MKTSSNPSALFPATGTLLFTYIKRFLFFAVVTALPLLVGCSKEDDTMPVKRTAQEKLIARKWTLNTVTIRVDNGSTYSLTRTQWQAVGILLDNITFRADGRYSSSGPSGNYTLKQNDTALELTNEPFFTMEFLSLSLSDYEFSGRTPEVAVNPEKAAPTAAEHGVAAAGLAGLAYFKEVDTAKVKTVQLLFTYNGV
ncbi:hypothetical protein GCM10023189_12860 [Nibrella saemangeumensis]|uniref:DUF5004 domain-containing protein n=1 Tax=Nibrella saemangeumensis TaxID=1084526 RepID=A0ABP8MKR2_9BACT